MTGSSGLSSGASARHLFHRSETLGIAQATFSAPMAAFTWRRRLGTIRQWQTASSIEHGD